MMLKMKTKFWLTLASLLLMIPAIILQAQDEEVQVQRRNTVKLDITSVFLYRSALIFSYERVTKPNQSFAVTAGYQEFPRLIGLGENIEVKKDFGRRGLKLGAEYRFYLAKENKYKAPHGVYIGPYTAFHQFKNERNLEITTESGEVQNAYFNSEINVFNLGVQVGYQFLLNNRWTIDLVFIGPSISRYSGTLNLDGNFNIDEEQLYNNRIIERLVNRFPLLDNLIQDQTVEVDGKTDKWSFGYRYQILVGYHFGRGK